MENLERELDENVNDDVAEHTPWWIYPILIGGPTLFGAYFGHTVASDVLKDYAIDAVRDYILSYTIVSGILGFLVGMYITLSPYSDQV